MAETEVTTALMPYALEVLEAVGRSEQLTKCVGKRDCRVRLSPDAVRVEVAAAATCA